ncbi:universal stress protein [Salegentibacter sp. LM13S]|uniref:universal stress protein n=1 Tax=Salegentibacter lacus TaxID=2873599 RepID=UPI001CCBD367|nr:universal stress protein [Salegentibacter lacus]MBZ9630804.1 universal stress protein [Salegentibacter lacus]
MKLIKRILVATDLSNASENVVENAIDMAKIFESEIALVYVLPTNTGNKKTDDLLKKFAAKELGEMNKLIKDKGITPMEPFLEYGDFSDKVIEVSKKIEANIIFAGAGEKLKDNVFQLGSNAGKIIKKSNKPVFIVKNQESLSLKSIVCPIDFSVQSRLALKNATMMARRFDAELVILSVYDASHLFAIRNKINIDEQIESLDKDYQRQFDTFLKDFNLNDLKITKEIKQGEPAKEILNTIKHYESDLLIMGTTGKSGISKILMGSVTEKVIREVPCSFITLKSEDVIKLELESKIRDIEFHFNVAQQLFKDGLYEEAIDEYNKCLSISFMHVPSLKSLVKVYEKLGDSTNAKKYKTMITEVLDKMYNEKIESEVRKFRN